MAFICSCAMAGLSSPGPMMTPGVGLYPMLPGDALGRLPGVAPNPAAGLLQQPALLQAATLTVLLGLLGSLMQNQLRSSGGGSGQAGTGGASGTDASASTGTGGSSGPLSSGTAAPSKNGFAEALLQKIGAPVTAENLKFLDAWQRAEGGSADNPFNTTQDAPGARNFNSVGVKRYASMEQGLEATVKTLQNGRYGSIIAALRQGNSAKAAAQALAGTPWGTGELVQKILG